MLLEDPNIERYFNEWNPIQLLRTKVVALDEVKIVLDWETLFVFSRWRNHRLS